MGRAKNLISTALIGAKNRSFFASFRAKNHRPAVLLPAGKHDHHHFRVGETELPFVARLLDGTGVGERPVGVGFRPGENEILQVFAVQVGAGGNGAGLVAGGKSSDDVVKSFRAGEVWLPASRVALRRQQKRQRQQREAKQTLKNKYSHKMKFCA